MTDNFIQIPFTTDNLDRYLVRSSIKKAIESSLPQLKGSLLDVGCGKMPYKEFILQNSNVETYTGLDIDSALIYDNNLKPDFRWNGQSMPFENNHFDCAIGTEVLEHCPEPEVVLKETCRVLKQNGLFFFTVPFLWPFHEVPHDEYRYTPWSLERHILNAGFSKVELMPLGGWHASMAQMLGIWVRRAPMTERKRNILSNILKPIIRKLIKVDKFHPINFAEGQMVTGVYGIASKR